MRALSFWRVIVTEGIIRGRQICGPGRAGGYSDCRTDYRAGGYKDYDKMDYLSEAKMCHGRVHGYSDYDSKDYQTEANT